MVLNSNSEEALWRDMSAENSQNIDAASEGAQFVHIIEEDMHSPDTAKESLDLVHSINGMFRILDLVSEQGCGGLGETLNSNEKKDH